MSHKENCRSGFLAYDPWESFSANSRGVNERSIIDCYGKSRLGESAWELGKRAYDILTDEFEEPPTNADLHAIRKEIWDAYSTPFGHPFHAHSAT